MLTENSTFHLNHDHIIICNNHMDSERSCAIKRVLFYASKRKNASAYAWFYSVTSKALNRTNLEWQYISDWHRWYGVKHIHSRYMAHEWKEIITCTWASTFQYSCFNLVSIGRQFVAYDIPVNIMLTFIAFVDICSLSFFSPALHVHYLCLYLSHAMHSSIFYHLQIVYS